ncbi:hypothetical protein OIV83_003178 [Microbotryomycetes sp. JL201]|nr:hypothetical protein OIV83_003178 [Microbotryomycetes sp. JL201]
MLGLRHVEWLTFAQAVSRVAGGCALHHDPLDQQLLRHMRSVSGQPLDLAPEIKQLNDTLRLLHDGDMVLGLPYIDEDANTLRERLRHPLRVVACLVMQLSMMASRDSAGSPNVESLWHSCIIAEAQLVSFLEHYETLDQNQLAALSATLESNLSSCVDVHWNSLAKVFLKPEHHRILRNLLHSASSAAQSKSLELSLQEASQSSNLDEKRLVQNALTTALQNFDHLRLYDIALFLAIAGGLRVGRAQERCPPVRGKTTQFKGVPTS